MIADVGNSQDRHFTQFYANPLTLNPALTGNMFGKYRMSAGYRNQWQTAIDHPFKSITAAFDMNFHLGLQRRDKVGVGVMFFSDKAGVTDFVTNQISISSAFHKSLDLNESRFLSGGIQIGLVQKSINYENISFNDQFDGDSGYTFPTGEELPVNNFGYFDLSTGIFFTILPTDRTSFHIGLSGHHVNLPDVSFDDEIIDRINPSIAFHIGGQLPMGQRLDFLPRALVYLQGPSLETNIGGNFKLLINQFAGNSIYIGSWGRMVRDEETGVGLDAIILLVAVEVEKVRFGISFDGNVSGLRPSTTGFGAFELSLAYTGRDESKIVLCPTF